MGSTADHGVEFVLITLVIFHTTIVRFLYFENIVLEVLIL